MKGVSTSNLLRGTEKHEKRKEDIQMKGTTNPLYAAIHDRRASMRPQPKNTILYEVRSSDTLTNVAARFHTTPSELVNLNRLSSRTLFSGQIVYVPDSAEAKNALLRPVVDDSVNGQNRISEAQLHPIHLLLNQHLFFDDISTKSPSILAENLDKESIQTFLKINAKHITDGEGVVSGVLLVTPNHIMFDPNVSDPLIVEHGAEKYGVIAPMYMVARTAIYPDIVRMKIKDSLQARVDENSLKLYHSQIFTMKKSHSHDNSFEKARSLENLSPCPENKIEPSEISTNLPLFQIKEGQELFQNIDLKETISTKTRKSVATPKSAESDKTFVFVNSSDIDPFALEDIPSSLTSPSPDEAEKSNPPLEDIVKKKKTSFEKTKEKLQKGLRRLSVSEGIFTGNMNRRMSLPVISTSPLVSKTKLPGIKKAKSKELKPKQEKENLNTSYMNMVDDKPELFVALDKLIPRPAKSFDDNPLYLCLRMGKPLKKSVHNRLNPVMDFGHKLKSEYWFSIPKERVDNLYFFILRWTPEKYGDIDNINLRELGFEPIDDIDEIDVISEPSLSDFVPDRRATWAFPWQRKKSSDCEKQEIWKFLQNQQSVHDLNITESEVTLPELTSPSCILSQDHIKKLNDVLPARAVGYSWELIYSTAINGFSLKTLYREMQNYDSPVLIIILNTNGSVFGAMLSCPLKLSDHFYGTGESFLFTFYPEFKYFPWSGENNYFIKGNTSSFAIGASDGQFGLWLDDDLYHGCTKECRTFNNSCLSDAEDFVVKSLEAWGFV